MIKKTTSSKTNLRQQAEETLSKRKKSPATKTDTTRLIHELEVHQIELEMQNEELMQARTEAEALQRQYADLYDLAPVGYFTLTRNGAMSQVNLTGATMLGAVAERGKLLKRKFGLFVAPASRPAFAAFLEKVFLAGDKKQTCEVELLKGKTESFWAQIEAAYDELHETCRALVVDISERKRIEKEVLAARIELQAIMDTIPDYVLQIEPDLTIHFINRTYPGVKIEQVVGSSILNWIQPENRDAYHAMLMQVLKTSQPQELETVGTGVDNAPAWYLSRVTPMLENGRATRLMMIGQDITERKRAEEALRRSEAEVRQQLREIEQIYAYSPIGLFIFDREYHFQRINERMAEINGFSVAHHFGKTLDEIVPDLAGFLKETYRPIFERGEPVLNVEIHGKTPRDPDHECDWIGNYFPLKSETGEVIGLIGAVLEITGRKQAEDQLRTSEARLKFSQQVAHVGHWTWDTVSNRVTWSDEMKRIFGLDPEIFDGDLAEVIERAIHPDDRERVNAANNTVITEQNSVSLEYRVIKQDGSIRTIWAEAAEKILDADGKILKLSGVVQDITERKREKEALRKNQALLNATGLMAQVGGWEIDLATQTLTWTEEVYRIHEVEDDFVPNVNAGINFYAPESRPVIDQAVQRAIELGMPFDVNLQIITAKGNWRWVHAIGQVEQKDGKVARVFGTFQNITERKQAEDALRESESRLKFSQQIAHVGHWAWDTVTNRVTWSDEMKRIFGLDPAVFAGDLEKVIARAIHPDDREKVNQSNATVISEQKSAPLEYRVIWPDGSVHTVWAEAGEKVFGADGKIIRLSGIVQDITERKRAQEKILHVNRLYATISQINQAIVRAQNPDTLFTEICRVAIEYGNFRMAWIGLVDDSDGHVKPITFAGEEQGYLSSVSIMVHDPDLGGGPTGTAIREERCVICQDIANDPRMLPWREQALQHGYRSSASVPIFQNNRPIGTLTVYASEPQGFNDDDQKLLDEIGQDISYAVDALNTEVKRKQAEEQLRKLSRAVEQSASTIVITDKTGNIEYVNPKFTETTGYTAEEAYGQNPRVLKSGHTTQAEYERMWLAITTGQGWRGEFLNRKKNGELYWESATLSPIFDEHGKTTHFVAVKEDITERKQNENKLRAANERFQQLADNIQEVFWIRDAVTGEDLYISQAGEKVWGHTIEEMMQIPDIFINSILPEDRTMVLLTIEQQRTGQKTEMEYRLVHPDGSVHWIWDRAFPIFDEAGSVLRVAGVAMDVTERKQITDALQARDVLLREAQRIARLGHYQFDLLTGFWESSDVLNTIFGIDNDYRKDMNGWAGLIHPAQRDEMLAYFTNDVVAERKPFKPFDREYQIMRNDNGQTRWVHGLVGQLEFDSAGNPVRMLGTIQDITERRLIEAESHRHLVELEALYENGLAVGQLLTPSEIGNRIISTFEHYLAWHHVTVRLRKEKSDELELVAFNLPDFEEDEKPGAVQRFKDMVNKVGQGLSGWVVQTGIPIRTGNVHDYRQYVEYQTGIQSGLYMPLKIGESVIGSISVESKLADAFSAQDERLLATLANQAAVAFENARLFQSAHQELSERIHVEQMLELERNSLAQRVEERTFDLSRANANLARALRVKDEFLANMSHELRTPLNAILGLSESLAEQTAGPLNEKQMRYITTVSESGHHLLSLINDILDLAKIEAGQITLDVNKVDINSVCQSSLRMVKQLARKKNQEVLVDVDGGLNLMWADERRLKQMLVNLLGNAVKFTPEGGKLGLEVHGDQDANKVTFTIWDTGIGIKETDLPRLFQPFVQLDTGLARETSGTGLGLALVSQMARLHGGSVSVTSQPGKGSRFTIMLPWEPALAVDTLERLKITGKFRPIKLTPGHKPTILLIEDTQEVIMMLSDYLELNGFKVITAHDGVEGITQAQLTHPDLILMDIQMPRMGGFEATKKLRSEPEFEHTPIIALTALAMPNDRERCLAAGMDEYITKPVHLRGLIKVIEAFLSGEKETKPQ